MNSEQFDKEFNLEQTSRSSKIKQIISDIKKDDKELLERLADDVQ